MRKNHLRMAGMGVLSGILLALAGTKGETVYAGLQKQMLVDGSPQYSSAFASPDDVSAGGYKDAVDYTERICNGKSSTWTFQNGYIYWSTKTKIAERAEATVCRTVGWDVTFSADRNQNGTIEDTEQVTISVAKTIRGETLDEMNYYYIDEQQVQTAGGLYAYSLYAMSCDRLEELATNYEAYRKSGATPVTDSIFSADQIEISISAIVTLVEYDAGGAENVKGCITAENGTDSTGISPDANGTVTTGGLIYHCGSRTDYNRLEALFGEGSMSGFVAGGMVENTKLILEFYTDAEHNAVDGTDGWSVDSSTGRILYQGRPYTETCMLWEEVGWNDGIRLIKGGYTRTGEWKCQTADVAVTEGERYHTSYLAQYAVGSASVSGSEGATLKLYAEWKENEFTVEYYTKTTASANGYTRIAVENCTYGQTYRYALAEHTTASVPDGITLLYWTRDAENGSSICGPGQEFSGCDYPETKIRTGEVVKLYAVWGATSYTITCSRMSIPEGAQQNKEALSGDTLQFFEIYGVGYTMDNTLSQTKTSLNPFFWSENAELMQAFELLLPVPEAAGYTWNGIWDDSGQRPFFFPDGTAAFTSAKTFEENTSLYGNWKKTYTLTVRYRLGDGVIVLKNEQGYGVDENGYLTVNGSVYRTELSEEESLTVLEIPDCVQKEGYTGAAVWKAEGTGETVFVNKTYRASTLAQKTGADLAVQDATLVLAMSWSSNRYYVDYCFWNDNSMKYEAKASQTCIYGESYSFYTENQMTSLLAPSGMEFAGWNTQAKSQTVRFRGGEIFSNLSSQPDARVSLYVVWTGKTYSIELNGNCPPGAGEPVVMEQTQIFYVFEEGFLSDGESKTTRNACQIVVPSCAGYRFTGYYSAQTGGVLMIDASGKSTEALSYSETGRSIYAHWEQNTYRITFHANGGQFAESSLGNEQGITMEGVVYGSLLPAAVAPYRTGYSFQGYSGSADGTGELWYNEYLNSENRRYEFAQDMELFAVWTDDRTPVGTIRGGAGGSSSAWSNRNVTLDIIGADAGSGVVKIQLFQKRYFDSNYQLWKEWNMEPAKSCTVSTVIDTNGISSFYCVVYDAAGNTNRRLYGTSADIFDTVTTTVYLDKVAPRVTVPELSDCRVGNDGVYVSVYASDDVIE